MSSKSTQHPSSKHSFSKKIFIIALIMVAVFATIIIRYPQIFSPANVGTNTAPATSTAPTNTAK